jgi:glutamate--cysteine ligase
MNWDFAAITKWFSGGTESRLLRKGKWGLEKESQRVTPSGNLALTHHPAIFGNKLTNPSITTDFAESQLELITPPHETVEETYQSLQALQAEAEEGIGGELLWPLSMPPRLPAEEDIPIARFGDSSEGREKAIYRRGLALRYGKKMQMISGLHYNFSFGEELLDYLYQRLGAQIGKQAYHNQLYFAVARNYLRYRWLLIYLFGASPTIDDTYDSVIRAELKMVAACCPKCCETIKNDRKTSGYSRYATSLRVSRFGYSNPESSSDYNSFNDLDQYIGNLRRMLATKNLEYGKLGIFREGIQVQLNDNVLQKESEFYAAIRFKQTGAGETQLDLLERKGVEYLEARILDLNPFERVGISLPQLYFLQVFMLFCLFESSPPFTEAEFIQSNQNHHLVALLGRKPGLVLESYRKGPEPLQNWAREIFEKLIRVARLMDQGAWSSKDDLGRNYQNSVAGEYLKMMDPKSLPSARITREMAEHRESFIEFGLRKARAQERVAQAHGTLVRVVESQKLIVKS